MLTYFVLSHSLFKAWLVREYYGTGRHSPGDWNSVYLHPPTPALAHLEKGRKGLELGFAALQCCNTYGEQLPSVFTKELMSMRPWTNKLALSIYQTLDWCFQLAGPESPHKNMRILMLKFAFVVSPAKENLTIPNKNLKILSCSFLPALWMSVPLLCPLATASWTLVE